jgi:hypothetical protein
MLCSGKIRKILTRQNVSRVEAVDPVIEVDLRDLLYDAARSAKQPMIFQDSEIALTRGLRHGGTL